MLEPRPTEHWGVLVTTSFPHLLAEGRIGTMPLRNRILMTPMGEDLCHPDGTVSDTQLAYAEARARGFHADHHGSAAGNPFSGAERGRGVAAGRGKRPTAPARRAGERGWSSRVHEKSQIQVD